MTMIRLGRLESGRLLLAADDGQTFEFGVEYAPHVAVMLARECRDNGERAFVRDEWSDVDDSEEWDGTNAW